MVVIARERLTSRKRTVALVFGICGWWWWPEKGQTSKNECDRLFLGVVGGSGGQSKVKPLKTSSYAHFQGVWVVVVVRERSNPPKTSAHFQGLWVARVGQPPENLVFGDCRWWWWPGKGQPPKNEPNSSFLGMVVAGKSQTPNTSVNARFRGLWMVVLGQKCN